MTWFTFVLSILATFRLALMLSSEEGPAAIFAKMRRKVPPKTNPGRGIRCFLCWSVWVSGVITAWMWHVGYVATDVAPAYWMGVSGGAIITKWLEK